MKYTSKTKKKKQKKTTLQTELNIYSNKTWGYKKKITLKQEFKMYKEKLGKI